MTVSSEEAQDFIQNFLIKNLDTVFHASRGYACKSNKETDVDQLVYNWSVEINDIFLIVKVSSIFHGIFLNDFSDEETFTPEIIIYSGSAQSKFREELEEEVSKHILESYKGLFKYE